MLNDSTSKGKVVRQFAYEYVFLVISKLSASDDTHFNSFAFFWYVGKGISRPILAGSFGI
jgi:hypothetical protein